MSKKRILVVDDEEDMVYTIKIQLQAQGYEILTASDGKEGLDIARRESPDLIILDLMLPKLDGYKVCRMLKFDNNYKKIPIILFTARIQKSDEQTGRDVGADAFLNKPFNLETLLAKIKQLIGK